MKKIISALCVLILIMTCLVGCTSKQENAPVEGNTLRFTNLVEDMKSLDGQTVSITGYMCKTLSSEEGVIYLMSAPCRKAPFIGNNSAELADTLAIKLRDKDSAVFTEKLITVEGTLVFEEITDIKGYTYSYYLKDATFSVAQAEQLEGNAAKWQELTSSGVIEEVNRMYKYVDFLCNWPSTRNSEGGYSSPRFVLYNVENEGAIFYYGYEESYFDDIITKIETLGQDYSALITNVQKAEALSEKALSALENGEYTLADDGSGMYVHKNGDEIKNEYAVLYSEYSDWLTGWSL